MNSSRIRWFASVVIVTVGAGGVFAQDEPGSDSRAQAKKKVLVELFTSQGCDYCPDAERLLGILGKENPRIVPVALHIDYFNDPWVDPFSDRAFSQRQMAYNNLYHQPKNPDYGIYYTPMLMIDGKESVNGRDRVAAAAAIRRALTRKSSAALDATLDIKDDPRSGTLNVSIGARSNSVLGRKLLVGALIRQDRVTTFVESGENARKTLTNSYPARAFQYQYVVLNDKSKKAVLTFPLRIEPRWDLESLGVAVFVQDNETGIIHQAEILPWRPDHPGPGAAGSRPGRTQRDIRADRRDQGR
jgi:hypothetical protein